MGTRLQEWAISVPLGAILAGAPAVAQEPADGWRIRLDASSAGLVDKGRLTLGSGSGAASGLDAFDTPHPPALPSRRLDVYTEHQQVEPGWAGQLRPLTRYQREYVPALGAADWAIEFTVATDQANDVTLTWTLTEDLDLAGHFLALRDLESGSVVDPRSLGTYIFSPTSANRRFRLEMTAGRSAPPIAFGQAVSLPEDASAALLLLAQDPEGDTLTYEIVTPPTHGALAGTAPNLTYIPSADYFGADAFSFLARDHQGSSNVATVSLTITPINDAPVSLASSATADEDQAIPVTLTAADVDGDSLGFTVVQAPSHGSLEGTPPSLIYRPGLNYNGIDSFSFVASDGLAQSQPALVSLTVNAVDDPPKAAFTVPGPDHNVATWDNNVGSHFEGASAVATSQFSATSGAANAIDENLGTRWSSALGQTTAQGITVTLPHGRIRRISGVRLVNPASTLEAVRRFEIRVSTTTNDAGAFSTVLTDIALNNVRIQEFPFTTPVDARFVQLRILENYGSATSVTVASFEVIAADDGGLPSYSALPGNAAAALEGAAIASATSEAAGLPATRLIDGNNGTAWTSAVGQPANQAIVIELAREKAYTIDRIRLVNPTASAGRSVRNFRVGVAVSSASPASFVDVFTGIALDNGAVQEFALTGGPVQARYLRLLALDNHGNATQISLAEIQVVPAPSVGAVSGVDGASDRPENLLDGVAASSWRTPTGQTLNQFVKFQLRQGFEHLVDRVRLQPYVVATAEAVRDFELLVSTTTDADSEFSPVLSGTLLNNAALQEFTFPAGPVRARYVKLIARNNYGGVNTRLSTLEVVSVGTDGNTVSIPAPVQVARNESPAHSANGAVTVDFSSAFSSTTLPGQMLDHVIDFPWATTSTTNQFATIRLGARALLNGVRIMPRADCCGEQSVKDFEVWLSDTTADAAAFTQVLTGTVLNNAREQTFAFGAPAYARFVKYVPLGSHSSPTYIATSKFDVLVDGFGGVVASSGNGLNTPAELALDGNPVSVWRTASGAVTNQWVKVRLSGGVSHRVFGVRISPDPSTAPRNFEVRVSNTTSVDTAFTTVVSGILSAAGTVQEFVFPTVDARYVEFRWLSGYAATNIAVRDLEVLAETEAGAILRGASSQASPAAQALDANPAGFWSTASGQFADQWFAITLPGHAPILVDHVALQSSASAPLSSPREFEIQVSTTTADPAAFVTAFAGTLRNNGARQHFTFEQTPAKHLRLLVRNNYGAANVVLQSFQAFSPEFGGLSARFLDRSTSIDGTVQALNWSFGDSGVSNVRDPEHSYAVSGTYTVALTATASTGLVDSRTLPYRAAGRPPAAFEHGLATPLEGQGVLLTDVTADPSGIVLREWDFGDSVKTTSGASSTTHAYVDNGTYTVTLRVTNSFGVTATVSRPITILNAVPSVTANPDRHVVVGDVVPFSASISDAGYDTQSCVWSFGDGTTATTCVATHAYASPSDTLADPVVFTATVVVTDDDGGMASDTTRTTVYPARLITLNNQLAGPIGIDWSPYIQKLVVANRYNANELVTVGLEGQRSPVLLPNMGTNEVNVVVSAGLGGFEPGAVYYNTALAPGQLARLKFDANGLVSQVERPWVTHPEGRLYGGITFDTVGTFGYDLLVVWQNGVIYRTNAAGQSSVIGRLPAGGEAEGATVAGPGFGPASGCLITVQRESERVFSVCPGQPPAVIANLASVTTNQISWVRYIPAPGTLFLTDYNFGSVVRTEARASGMNLSGHVLISTEYGGETYDLYYDQASSSYKTRFHAYAPGTVSARLEDITYVPGRATLDPATSARNLGVTHTVTATVTDVYGAGFPNVPMTFVVTGANPRTAVITTDAGGVAQFTYAGVVSGEDTIVASYSVIVSNPVLITWTGNGAPVANGQSNTTTEDVAVAITLTGTDPENEALTFAIATPPEHGALSGATPNLTYTPTADYNGPDSFTFTVTDASGATSVSAAVAITVTPVNDAPVASPQSITTAEDTVAPITLAGTDPESEPLTFAVVIPPSHGTLSGAAPNLAYTPAPNYHGPDSFTFTATDASGATSASATTSIAVTPVNDAPSAAAQSITTAEDTAATITLTGTDPENEAVTFAIGTPPQHGTLSGAAPNLTYTPAANYFGSDSFTFTVTDASSATSAPATVSIAVTPVNDGPSATPQTVTTTEDTEVAIALTGFDPENQPFLFSVTTEPASGTLSGTAPNLTYTPAANYFGSDSFTFAVTDASGATSAAAMVSITVTPVNDAPTSTPQSLATDEDTPVAIVLSAVDQDNEAITFAVITEPTNGTLSGAAPNLTYTPAANFAGSDAFTFAATDATGATSALATVSITVTPVNDSPTAAPQSVATAEDTPIPIEIQASDTDHPTGLIFAITAPPQHGTLSGAAPNLTYTPASGYFGPDSFDFQATDPEGAASQTATVNLTVTPANDVPTATPQSVATPEDTPAAIVLAGSDPEDDALTYTIVNEPTNGALSGVAPNLTYTPAPDYAGADTFTFTVTDTSGAVSAAATVSITMTPVNDAPTATPLSVTTPQNTPIAVVLQASDVDDPTGLTLAITTPPQHGTLSGTAPSLIYTPATGYSGPDSFVFQATDPAGASSALTTVQVTVTPTGSNAPPVCSTATPSASVWPPNHQMVPVSILGVSDPDGGTITLAALSVFQDEPVEGSGDGNTSPDATLSPLAIRSERKGNGNGRVYTINFRATDPQGASCTGIVKVCVPKSQGGSHATCVDGGPLFNSTTGGNPQ